MRFLEHVIMNFWVRNIYVVAYGEQEVADHSLLNFSSVDCDEDGTSPNQVARFLDCLATLSEKNLNGGDLRLLPNPFSNPPEAVVSKGIESVKGFFEDVLKDEVSHRRAVKVVIIGAAGSGKTR